MTELGSFSLLPIEIVQQQDEVALCRSPTYQREAASLHVEIEGCNDGKKVMNEYENETKRENWRYQAKAQYTQTTSSRFCADAPEYKTRNNAKMIIALNQ